MSSLTWKRQVWFKAASMQGKTACIWLVFGGKRDDYRQKIKFRERKVARKPGMLPQTTLLKCMRSSWQFPFKGESQFLQEGATHMVLGSSKSYRIQMRRRWTLACLQQLIISKACITQSVTLSLSFEAESLAKSYRTAIPRISHMLIYLLRLHKSHFHQ